MPSTPAKVIDSHPKFLERWAKNYVDWYVRMGKPNADIKMFGMFTSDKIKDLAPYITKEFIRRGYKM